MNYLAHILLSGGNSKIQIGNFIGDFVKGNAYKRYPSQIAKGIMLHRKIDEYTDSHEVIKELKTLLRPEFGRYSGIIADMYFDHFLAIHFSSFSSVSLKRFARKFYLFTLLNYKYLPEKVKNFISHFIGSDRLRKYSTIEGLRNSLEIMTYHKIPALEPNKIISFLKKNYSDIDSLFLQFFPDINNFVREELKKQNNNMNNVIQPITARDIDAISLLQPEGWTNILPAFRFYIENNFCFPFKYIANNQLAGTGNLISFNKTAWLSHIIVDSNFRKQGIGSKVVNHLLQTAEIQGIHTISLFATEMGEPVYTKAGFRTVDTYLILQKTNFFKPEVLSENILKYTPKFETELLLLDQLASGEDRSNILKCYLDNCYVYIRNNTLEGYYLPDLNEGHIIANNDVAGFELMKMRAVGSDNFVLPETNTTAIDFLINNGFVVDKIRGRRMIYGKEIEWQPSFMYNRIGGNLG